MYDDWKAVKSVIFKYVYKTLNFDGCDPEVFYPLQRYNIEGMVNDLRAIKISRDEAKTKYLEIDNYGVRLAEAKEKYKNDMQVYRDTIKYNRKNKIEANVVKPVFVKIDKPVVPAKPKEKISDRISKPAPDDTLKAEIRRFCGNLKSARTNKDEHGTSYELTYKKYENQNIILGERAFGVDGIMSASLGPSISPNFKELKKKSNGESLLMYDNIAEEYHIGIIIRKQPKTKEEQPNKMQICAIDPGEKIFMTYFSPEQIGKIGVNMREKILKLHKRIAKYDMILKRGINRHGKVLKNRRHIKDKIKNARKRIKGYVNEVHKKAALYLCKNFEIILLPKFNTRQMVSKNRSLSRDVKRVLNAQSHYKFKQYLKAKAEEYGSQIYEVNEYMTSKTCTYCGVISDTYTNRMKECTCGKTSDRDLNGSRNIYIKCVNELQTKEIVDYQY
jgi:putative transposase